MLFRQQLSGRHERHLIPGFDCLTRGQCGNDGLAAAHVALQQPLHWVAFVEIGADFAVDAFLRLGQGEG